MGICNTRERRILIMFNSMCHRKTQEIGKREFLFVFSQQVLLQVQKLTFFWGVHCAAGEFLPSHHSLKQNVADIRDS